MFSGLNVLHSAVMESNEVYQGVCWSMQTQATQQHLYNNQNKTYWNKVFLNYLSDLVIDTDLQVIKGSLKHQVKSKQRENNIKRLSQSFFKYSYWVYAVYVSGGYFMLQGFSDRTTAITHINSIKSTTNLYYATLVQIPLP